MALASSSTALGWKAPDFALEATDGRRYRLGDLCGPKGTLVMFICNHCPYVQAVLDDILGYKVPDHQVHIHYYKPRGDQKEAWDNIDLEGFLGERMQLKINFLCKDSILAAPLVVDLVRLLDCAKKNGESGIQRQLSIFFKSPYVAPGETPVHDLFKQEKLLVDWVKAHSHGGKAVVAPAVPAHTNGAKAHVERTP